MLLTSICQVLFFVEINFYDFSTLYEKIIHAKFSDCWIKLKQTDNSLKSMLINECICKCHDFYWVSVNLRNAFSDWAVSIEDVSIIWKV